MVDYARLSRAELQSMAAAGRALAACERAFAATGGSPLAAALEGAAPVYEWQHYPAHDVYDPASHAQFFYHAHPAAERGDEHGHFHTFLRGRGMPAGVRPLVMPELAIADNPAAPKNLTPSAPQSAPGEEDEPWCHLVGIAMSAAGRPLRFFTCNRWVTGETWYPAADVARMLDRFAFAEAEAASAPAPLLGQWIAALMALYRPAIAALVAERDARVTEWRWRRRAKVHVFDDPRLDVIAALAIDIERHLAALDAALKKVA